MKISDRSKPKGSGFDKKFVLFNSSLIILLVKLITIQNIQDGIWPGADSENYLTALVGLTDQGLLSTEEKLTYWPAGYPMFIYFLSIIFGTSVFPALAIVQSLFFSFSVYYFSRSLLTTRLKNYSIIVFVLISLNPTLALSSLSLGYESIAASGVILSLTLVVNDIKYANGNQFKKSIFLHSLNFGILAFFQPRLIVIGVFITIFWIYYKKQIRKILISVLLATLVMLLIPSSLILRNYQANGLATISTNLGNTMMLGVGNGASGGYLSPNGAGVPCVVKGDRAEQDKSLVECALSWYLDNPGKSIELAFKKTIYFWSPWYGPAFNGTMARNPWLKINPIRSMTSTPDGARLVFGDLGKFISYSWVALTLLFLFYGFVILWRLGGIERFLGAIAGAITFIALATTWLTLGDNRFRLPIMGMSLFLQAIGIRTLFRGGKPPMVDGPTLR